MKKLKASALALALASTSVFAAESQSYDKNVFFTNLTDTPHKVRLFNSGLASFEERLEMIERAQKSIDIEYFIYNADKSGKIFTQALIKKAKEGVKVRMLLDTFMIKSLITPFHVTELLQNGIEVKYFNNTSSLSLVKGMYRNHRKLLIVDDREIITGGRNIGDEYFDLREDFNFLDRELHVEGDLVAKIKESFEVFWTSKAAVKVERPKMPQENDFKYRSGRNSNDGWARYRADLSDWKKSVNKAIDFLYSDSKENVLGIRAKGRELLAETKEVVCNDMTFASEFPIVNKSNRPLRILKNHLYGKIANAEKKVLFDSPYFIVDDESKAALDKALDKKVEVSLLTNGLNSTDAIYVYDVFKSIIKDWVQKGLVAYTFKGEKPASYGVVDESIEKARFGVHAKTFVIDNKETIVGTYNFDPRSANYNAEMIISCNDNPELAKLVTDDVELRMNDAFKLDTVEKVDQDAFYKVGFFKRLAYGVLKIPSNIFDYLL